MQYLFFLSCGVLPMSCASADSAVPPYVQTQIDSLDQQIGLLNTQKQQLEAEFQTAQGMQNEQLKAQIDSINQKIKLMQDQKSRLSQSK